MLHQAAFWCADEGVLRRLHAAGAKPELVGQDEAKWSLERLEGHTPLQVSKRTETTEKRELWRESFCAVFGLPGQTELSAQVKELRAREQELEQQLQQAQQQLQELQTAPDAPRFGFCKCGKHWFCKCGRA